MSQRYELETDGDAWGHRIRVYDNYSDFYDAKYYWESAGHGTDILYAGPERKE